MSICGKLKNVERGKNKRLAKCKSLFVMTNISLLVILSCVNKYLCVPVFADSEVSYYTAQDAGNITIGDMVISLQNASGFTITDDKYNNAINSQMGGQGQTIDYVMSLSESDAKQYLQVCINNAENNGAKNLSNSLTINQDTADYINQSIGSNIAIPQSSSDLLYESIKATYDKNNELVNNNNGSARARFLGGMKTVANAVGWGSEMIARATCSGILQASLYDAYKGSIKTGAPVTTPDSILNLVPNGGRVASWRWHNSNSPEFFICYDYAIPVLYDLQYPSGCCATVVKPLISGVSDAPIYINASGIQQTLTRNRNISGTQFGLYGLIGLNLDYIDVYSGLLEFQTENDMNNYFRGLASDGTYKPTINSPDVVGDQGNVSYDSDNDNINITQNYDPFTMNFTPIKSNSNSYNDYRQTLNNNTSNNDYSQNGNVYNNYITNNYITNNTPVPTPTPTPITPPQPDIPVVPSIDNLPEEVVQELTDNMIPDLSAFFPFCIPFDIMAIASAFSSDNREPIILDFDLNLSIVGTYHIHVDLSPWDEVASLARALELALFILGLAQYARSIDAVGL